MRATRFGISDGGPEDAIAVKSTQVVRVSGSRDVVRL